MKATPLAAHLANSLPLIGREASEMSVSFSWNFLKPLPVPLPRTLMLTPGCWATKASRIALEIGCTVLLPSISILPTKLEVGSLAAGSLPTVGSLSLLSGCGPQPNTSSRQVAIPAFRNEVAWVMQRSPGLTKSRGVAGRQALADDGLHFRVTEPLA